MPAGYSGTPLAKKLGIKSEHQVALVNQPDYYFDLFEEFPEDAVIVEQPKKESLDFIHLFCRDQSTLFQYFPDYVSFLKKNGQFWISWPKKSSKVKTDINENIIRDYSVSEGLVDVKVAAIDQIRSGLKIVYRKKDR